MKKIILALAVILMAGGAIAQKKQKGYQQKQDTVAKQVKQLPQPFKGGIDTMQQFFKDNLTITPQIVKAKASGSAIIKFSVESKGFLTSIVIYYADDYLLAQPAIDALRRTNGKWVIPTEVTTYDFVIQFTYNYKPDGTIKAADLTSILDFYQKHQPIIAKDQVPLNNATLLPTIVVNYK